jgi:hypothetical protein
MQPGRLGLGPSAMARCSIAWCRVARRR